MTQTLTSIIAFSLAALFIGLVLYPPYIRMLQRLKMGKTIRENAVTGDKASIFAAMHKHKAGTPTMGGGLFLVVVAIMVFISYFLQKRGYTNNWLFNQKESYMLLFGFFSMGLIGLVDDIFNIKGIGKVKGLSAKTKTIAMVVFAGFMSYWFYSKLGVDYVYIRPLNLLRDGGAQLNIGIFFPILTFIFIIGLVNAINITDGLDGLVGGMMSMMLLTLMIPLFANQAYIATTVVTIATAALFAFLWFNISPAKVFMGDSGSFSLGGLLSAIILVLNMRGISILIPFLILFLIFEIEIISSFLQIFWKKTFKKKLFKIAPFHHLLEHHGMAETTIVMKFRFVQGILCTITMTMLLYQML